MAEIERDLESSKRQLKKILKLREIAGNQDDEETQLVYLSKENQILRTEFKEMNKNLNKFIDMMKDLKYKRSSKSRKVNQSMRASKETKLDIKQGELKSYETMIENMKKEQKRLRRRLDVVGDPGYSLSLRRNIIDKKERIQTLEEKERKFINDKFLRDKDADRVMMNGQSDAMRETQDKAKELTFLADHLNKIEKKIRKQENMKEDAEETTQIEKDKLVKLEQEANEKGLDLHEIYGLTEKESQIDFGNDAEAFERKKLVIQQSIMVKQTRYQKKLKDLKEKYETLLKAKNDCIEYMRVRNDQITEVRGEANELLVKSKVRTQEEIEMEEANQDETLNDLPDLSIIEDDPTMLKINSALKGSKRRYKLNNTISSVASGQLLSQKASRGGKKKTKNAFAIRKKAKMPDFDKKPPTTDKAGYNIPGRKRDDDENSLENSSETKPMYGKKINAKPLGTRMSKPSFMS